MDFARKQLLLIACANLMVAAMSAMIHWP